MAYQTFRVEITRDESVAAGGVSIEITAYLNRLPGMLSCAPRVEAR